MNGVGGLNARLLAGDVTKSENIFVENKYGEKSETKGFYRPFSRESIKIEKN